MLVDCDYEQIRNQITFLQNEFGLNEKRPKARSDDLDILRKSANIYLYIRSCFSKHIGIKFNENLTMEKEEKRQKIQEAVEDVHDSHFNLLVKFGIISRNFSELKEMYLKNKAFRR